MKTALLILLTAVSPVLTPAQDEVDYLLVSQMSAGPYHYDEETGMGEFYRVVLTNKGTGETGEVRLYTEYLVYDKDMLDYKVRECFEIPADFLDVYIESGTIKISDWIAWDEVKINFLQKRLLVKLGKSLSEMKKTVINDENDDYTELHGKDRDIYNNITSMSRGPIKWNEASETGEYYRLFTVVHEIYALLYLEHIIVKGPELLQSELISMFRIPIEKFETAPFREEGGNISVTSWLSWNEAVIEYDDYGCTKLKLGPKLSDVKNVSCE